MMSGLLWLLGLLLELGWSLLLGFVAVVRLALALWDWHHTHRTQRKRPD